MRGRGRTICKVIAGALAVLASLLLLAQLLLPGIAASTISSRVGRYGSVRSVRVSAWPAIELLWGEADTVHLDAANLTISPQRAAALLWEARGIGNLDVSATNLDVGGLSLIDASLGKTGSALSAGGVVSAAAVKAALPTGVSMRLLRTSPRGVLVSASGGLFGASSPVQAMAEASEGKLVVRPLGLALEGARLVLFSDRHVHVDGVGAVAIGAGPHAYELTIMGRLR